MTYGYRFGDLVYYSVLGLPLEQGLRLLSSDHNVTEMVAKHLDHDLVVSYIVTYGVANYVVDGDEEKDFEYERADMFRNYAF
jgi:hypothetical protein